MDIDAISATAVREALRAIRYAKPLHDSPLLRLDILTLRLRAEATADTPQGRESGLGRYLDEVVWAQLTRLRGTERAVRRHEVTAESELSLLREDFKQGNIELGAWSMLWFRYMASSRPQVRDVADTLSVSPKTLRRRLTRGHGLLAAVLRDEEQKAERETTRPHNLPRLLTRFIGREREIADVRSLLAQHRLVTLTGVGGIGKSRLAMEVARILAQDYADGVWLVEMGPLDDSAHVVPSVAAVFDVKEQPRRPLIDTLCDYFEAKRLLVVLDNCEHLVEACGELAAGLLRRCPDLQVLGTSRERLHVDGEAVLIVPPLTLPESAGSPRPVALMHFDAIRLFTDRAGAAMPGFELTTESAAHVAEVCTVLDGLPLATELAASRMNVLSPRELTERLATPYDLLKDGRRPMRPQHETLRATMDWSYELLSKDEQVLFCRLSVFRGGWALEAAEAVCAGDGVERGDVLDLLTQLVDKSLAGVLVTGDKRRYRMLQTVRQYAASQLRSSGEAEAVHGRHLEHFLALAEEARQGLAGPEQPVWIRRLESEHTNLRAALRWSRLAGEAERGLRLGAAMGLFWRLRAQYGVGREALTGLLALRGADVRSVERANALHYAGILASEQDDSDEALSRFHESLAIRRAIGDLWNIGKAEQLLGNLALEQGDYNAARALLEQSLATRRELGDNAGVAYTLVALGQLAHYQGDDEAALALSKESLAIARYVGSKEGIAHALGNLGGIASDQGDFELARSRYEECLAIFRQLGRKYGIATSLANIGNVALGQGDYEAARQLLEEGLAGARKLNDTKVVTGALEYLSELASAQGQADRAARQLGAAAALREAAGLPVPPTGRESLDKVAIASRTALGDDAYDSAYAEGHALTMDEAVAYALGEVTWDELADEVAARVEAAEAEEQ